MSVPPESKVLIVGAGVFGISTAYHLLKRGFKDVTVIDRSEELPAKDGASNDFNRIVRSSYADEFYAKLAKEAIQSWVKEPEVWNNSYHPSGVLVVGQSIAEGTYALEAYRNDLEQGARVEKFEISDSIVHALKEKLGPQAILGFEGKVGYLNNENGWADAGNGTSALIAKVSALGGRVHGGKEVKRLIRTNGRTSGVECADGSTYNADLVVLATGSWTPSAFQGLGLEGISSATGQVVAMIQLTDEEAATYRNSPVMLNFETGFYCFPPTTNGIVKMAFHRAGFTHTVNGVSTPRTVTSHPENGLSIPREVLADFRDNFSQLYPDLAKKPFSNTRLCWYNDTPDGDWIIGRHREDQSLVFATGGSGHAYKFLPVIGRIVADAIQGKLDPTAERKFAYDRQVDRCDGSRRNFPSPQELDVEQLSRPEDLLVQ